jgi:hypothetical protein
VAVVEIANDRNFAPHRKHGLHQFKAAYARADQAHGNGVTGLRQAPRRSCRGYRSGDSGQRPFDELTASAF